MSGKTANRSLSPEHVAHLRKSGLNDEVIALSGCWSASSAEVAKITGWTVAVVGPGLVIPYPGALLPDASTFCRVRLDEPAVSSDGSRAKYLSPGKKLNPDGNRLFIPTNFDRSVIADPTKPIYITESEKGALKACQEGLPTIAFPGVWGWRKRDGDESKPIDDLANVNWKERIVHIVFDSDGVANPKVAKAEEALKKELTRRGAVVEIVRIPEPTFEESKTWGAKFGLDDFLVARGVDALNSIVLDDRRELPFGCEPITALLSRPIEEKPWLVDGIWPDGGCGFIAGEPKVRKSFLALSLAICVATGRPFLNRTTCKGSVILVDEENNRREVANRARLAAHGLGIEISELINLHVIRQAELRLDRPTTMFKLEALIGRIKPALIILDPLVRLHTREENDSSSISPMLSALRALQVKYGVAIVIVHHFKKKGDAPGRAGQRLRGSSDLHGWLDAAMYLDREGDSICVEFESRYGTEVDPMRFRFESTPDSVRWVQIDGPPPAIDTLILEHLRKAGDTSKTDLAKAIGRSGDDTSTAVENLEKAGKVTTYPSARKGPGKKPIMVRLRPNGNDAKPNSDPDPPLKGENHVWNPNSEQRDGSTSLSQNDLPSAAIPDRSGSEVDEFAAASSGIEEREIPAPDAAPTDAFVDWHGRDVRIPDSIHPPKGKSGIWNPNHADVAPNDVDPGRSAFDATMAFLSRHNFGRPITAGYAEFILSLATVGNDVSCAEFSAAGLFGGAHQ